MNRLKRKYTEVEFHACLLAHGWNRGALNPSAYWYTIDMWFKKLWPDRFVEDQNIEDSGGQMEFKLQFFSWIRELNHVKPRDDFKGLTHLCKQMQAIEGEHK